MSGGLSILVCVRNRADLTRAFFGTLVPSIAGEPRPTRGGVEILVYDDLSTDGTPELLGECRERCAGDLGAELIVVRGAEQGCFGTNMNALAARAAGDTLVLLNNDMLFEPGWLGPMLRTLDRHGPSIVGNRQVYPAPERALGRVLNHGGGAFASDLTPVNLYDGLDADLAPATRTRAMRFVTGACWVVGRALFNELGGFDPVFRNGFEDADLCLRAETHGAGVWYCGESVVGHYGSSTPGRFGRQAENRRAFVRRWRDALVPDLEMWTKLDGVEWPPRRPVIDAARALVRAPGVSAVAQRLSAVPVLQRAWRRARR